VAGDELTMARADPNVLAHLEWLGFVKPTGLVVSAPALVQAGAILERRDTEGQARLRACVEERELAPGEGPEPVIVDFGLFAREVLGWRFSPKGYAGMDGVPVPGELEVELADYGETLRPDLAVSERAPVDGAPPWQLLVRVLEAGQDPDRAVRDGGTLEASPHVRMERLLRETGVPAGLLCNGRVVRLISAPRGESSGWLDFKVADMAQPAGRPICAAMRLLLRERRLLALPRPQRLAALLADSRRFQNEVSEKLAEQVLHSLYELLRGFQAADDRARGELLRQPLADDPDEVYRALLTVVLRLVFLLYAEEREMLPAHEVFARHYSLAALHERLRDDAAHHPDTMGQRFGAWAQLLVLFRLVQDGAPELGMRPRHGTLYDPDRFPFLEGRPAGPARQQHERIKAPLVPDGTVYRVLENLLVLDAERISYRALDVEQIGSVYETMMGFGLRLASGRSVAIRPKSRRGAPTPVDLEELLATAPSKRAKWLQDHADRRPEGKTGTAVKEAATLEDLHAALAMVIDSAATPDVVPAGAMVLEPSAERRRSGSHYTPRTLTEPIVRTALEPVLASRRQGDASVPRPENILDLKVCDPAMGSGAFLVEACRQLADQLVEAWRVHGGRPEIPPDEDEVLLARRMVAQRCLYGVDRNPVSVDLAKMSLRLATLAREHPLTFVDHALRHGDALVGMSRRQIEAFHWDATAPRIEALRTSRHVERVAELRAQIRETTEDASHRTLRYLWDEVQAELRTVRLLGDLLALAFFTGEKARERETMRVEMASVVVDGDAERYRGAVEERRHVDPPLAPFHWEIELPEVFDREQPGFDAIVGNPPFAGKNTLAAANPAHYLDWLKQLHPGSHGNADLVAHFFRRSFNLLRQDATFGLIATNTIGQGDTRATGLRWVCTNGGEIYEVRRRVKWPGMAAVVVSVVHVIRGELQGPKRLDDREVEQISAFLFHRGGHDDPVRLAANESKSFQGPIVLGMGFTFDDTDRKGVASPLAEMERLIAEDPRNGEVIFPYIGGEEINSSPTHEHHRYVIDFFDREEVECRRRWPRLLAIVEERVRPERAGQSRKALRERWWQYAEKRPGLRAATSDLDRVLVCTLHSKDLSFVFLPARAVFSHGLAVFPLSSLAAFSVLQSRPHEVWARFFGSSMKDDLRYTLSDCFETFPFPGGWENDSELDAVGREYFEFRAALMKRNNEGLTRTYNRFHDPYERDIDIERLRELHGEMDRAVLAAYGWDDVPTPCEFILDYELDDEESSRRKKPYRYRWPDEVRDEVLARLIELNAKRADDERRSGAAAPPRGKRAAAMTPAISAGSEGLF
jgi:N-6 DNA Methylase